MTAAEASTLRAARYHAYEDELVEHVAVYAAEHGLTDLEDTCDLAIAGDVGEELVFSAIREDDELVIWVQRGLNLGWQVRP